MVNVTGHEIMLSPTISPTELFDSDSYTQERKRLIIADRKAPITPYAPKQARTTITINTDRAL